MSCRAVPYHELKESDVCKYCVFGTVLDGDVKGSTNFLLKCRRLNPDLFTCVICLLIAILCHVTGVCAFSLDCEIFIILFVRFRIMLNSYIRVIIDLQYLLV